MELVIPDVLDGDTQRKRVKLKKIHPYKARREELVIKLLETVSINLFSLPTPSFHSIKDQEYLTTCNSTVLTSSLHLKIREDNRYLSRRSASIMLLVLYIVRIVATSYWLIPHKNCHIQKMKWILYNVSA